MKFMELTDAFDSRKYLINVDNILFIERTPQGKAMIQMIAGNYPFASLPAKESYEDIKAVLKNL